MSLLVDFFCLFGIFYGFHFVLLVDNDVTTMMWLEKGEIDANHSYRQGSILKLRLRHGWIRDHDKSIQ